MFKNVYNYNLQIFNYEVVLYFFLFFLFAFFKQLRRHWLRKAQDEKLLVIMFACYI